MDINEALNNVLWAAEQAVELMQESPDYDEDLGRETFESIKVIEKVRPLLDSMAEYLTSTPEEGRVTS